MTVLTSLVAVLLVGAATNLVGRARTPFAQLVGLAGVTAGVYLLGQNHLPAEVTGGGASPSPFSGGISPAMLLASLTLLMVLGFLAGTILSRRSPNTPSTLITPSGGGA